MIASFWSQSSLNCSALISALGFTGGGVSGIKVKTTEVEMPVTSDVRPPPFEGLQPWHNGSASISCNDHPNFSRAASHTPWRPLL
jgi:hypothetical protein